MDLLKVKPASHLIGGIQTPCYGIYCGNELVRKISAFEYTKTIKMINKANNVIHDQILDLVNSKKTLKKD